MATSDHRKHKVVIGSLLMVLALASPVLAGAAGRATRPGAPRSVHAVAATASATVNWVKPASSGGAPIKSYVVTSHPSNKTCTTKATKCKALDSPTEPRTRSPWWPRIQWARARAPRRPTRSPRPRGRRHRSSR